MSSLVQQIEAAFLGPMRRLADELGRRHPGAAFQVYSHPVGDRTPYRGHDVGVECSLAGRPASAADSVALSVSLCHLTTTPRISAAVCWSSPSAHTEASFGEDWLSSGDWPEASPDVLEALGRAMPGLMAAFSAAVERGRPSDEEGPAA